VHRAIQDRIETWLRELRPPEVKALRGPPSGAGLSPKPRQEEISFITTRAAAALSTD